VRTQFRGSHLETLHTIRASTGLGLKAIRRFLLQEAKENTGKQDRGLKEKKLH
jgi:hypothetical protein